MKKVTQSFVVLALIGILCLGCGCDSFIDAAAEGVFGLVSDVTADVVSSILGINTP